MSNVKTNWTHATTDPHEAMISLVACLANGMNAWIELRKNGDQDFPIMTANPLLDDPFNWTMAYGTTRNEKEMAAHKYLNETEKDLTYNWTEVFGDRASIEAYKKDGTISEGLIRLATEKSEGCKCPVRIKDAESYRRDITGDNYKYDFFITYWKPKDNIPYMVPDDNVGDVFTICYDEGPANKKAALEKAAQFMLEYAKRL